MGRALFRGTFAAVRRAQSGDRELPDCPGGLRGGRIGRVGKGDESQKGRIREGGVLVRDVKLRWRLQLG